MTSQENGTTWKTYYDLKSLKRKRDGIVEIWLKQVPLLKTQGDKENVRRAIIKNRKLNKLATNGYERYRYTTTLIAIDCNRKWGRTISTKDHDESGGLLGTDTMEEVPWAPIIKGSMPALFLSAVCN